MIAKYRIIVFLFSMGISSIFFSFLGCGPKKEKNNNGKAPVDSNSMAYYPNDHKLTGAERKAFSNKFLEIKGVPTLEHLPLSEDYKSAVFRYQKVVAAKAIVLYYLIHVAHHEKKSGDAITYLKNYKLWSYVSPEERRYLNIENRTEKDDIPVTWRIENLNVLFWSLGCFENLSFPDKICDFSNYKNLPDIEKDPTLWINSAVIRNKEDILNEADLIYRIHWATVEASLKGKISPAGLNEDIVMERHFALNWLTMYAEEWDDITTDT